MPNVSFRLNFDYDGIHLPLSYFQHMTLFTDILKDKYAQIIAPHCVNTIAEDIAFETYIRVAISGCLGSQMSRALQIDVVGTPAIKYYTILIKCIENNRIA